MVTKTKQEEIRDEIESLIEDHVTNDDAGNEVMNVYGAAEEVLKYLHSQDVAIKIGGCVCEMHIGNPMVKGCGNIYQVEPLMEE